MVERRGRGNRLRGFAWVAGVDFDETRGPRFGWRKYKVCTSSWEKSGAEVVARHVRLDVVWC